MTCLPHEACAAGTVSLFYIDAFLFYVVHSYAMTLVLSRDANLFDVESIHALLESYARQGTLLPRTVSELCENIRDFVVAESDGQFTGCGALHLYGQHLAEIRSIAVLPVSQGQGIGRCLIETLLKEARRHGVGCVCLFTRVPEFFGKLGFKIAQRAELPDKIYKDCVSCPKLMDCDEIAMVIGKIPHNTNGLRDPLISIPLVRIGF